jgi:membrane protein implicated in regulation of membrane protease activity
MDTRENHSRDSKSTLAARIGALGFGALLCTLCCAAPIAAALGFGGLASSALLIHADKLAVGLLVLAVAAYLVLYLRRRQSRAACSVDCAARYVDRRADG